MRRVQLLILILGLATPAICHDMSDPAFIIGEFERVDKLGRLSQVVQKAVLDAVHDPVCPGMADAGQEFSSGCIVEQGRPCRRLVVAGNVADLWFVLYEAGGYSHSRNMLVMRLRGGKVEVTWSYLRVARPIAVDELRGRVEQQDPCLVSPPRERYMGNEIEMCLKSRGA